MSHLTGFNPFTNPDPIAEATKKDLKEQAQDALLAACQQAFESDAANDRDVFKEMDKQFARIEKLFGYSPKSWTRGV